MKKSEGRFSSPAWMFFGLLFSALPILASGGQNVAPAAAAAQPVSTQHSLSSLLTDWRFYGWLAVFGALLLAFGALARKSEVLRDAGPLPGCGDRRPFSLAKTQAAWWFFIILGSYLFIGVVTGSYLYTLNATALILLGIGAGTAVGGAVIDAGQQTPEAKVQQANAEAQANVEVAQAKAGLQAAQTAHDAQIAIVNTAVQSVQTTQAAATATPANQAAAQAAQLAQIAHADEVAQAARTGATVAAANADVAEKRLKLNAARNQTENFLTDILSDADGVSFHRFQNAAWTIVLSIIFGCMVIKNREMPKFDDMLLALMGISAGTYLGVKTVEPKVPT